LKSLKEKSNQQDKDAPEGSALKTAGPGGEITAGLYFNLFILIILSKQYRNQCLHLQACLRCMHTYFLLNMCEIYCNCSLEIMVDQYSGISWQLKCDQTVQRALFLTNSVCFSFFSFLSLLILLLLCWEEG